MFDASNFFTLAPWKMMKSKYLFNSNVPEDRLLISAARTRLDLRARSEMNRILQNDLDWERILYLSNHMGVCPLLRHHLSERSFARLVPEKISRILDAAHADQTMQSLALHGQLGRILSEADRNGIPLIVLKGAFLSYHVYRDISLRPMGDIDILCKPDHIRLFSNLLINMGYHQEPLIRQSTLHDETLKQPDHLFPFLYKNKYPVEVHFNIYWRTDHAEEAVKDALDTAVKADWNGVNAYHLSPEHQLLHLAVHLHKHFLMEPKSLKLFWFTDIHELIEYYGMRIDWNRLFEKAKRFGIIHQVNHILEIVEYNWATSFPTTASQMMESKTDIHHHALNLSVHMKLSFIYYYTGSLKMIIKKNSFQDMVRMFYRYIVPSREYLLSRYQTITTTHKKEGYWKYYIIHLVTAVKRVIQRFFFIK